jgi:hypothetical protein
MISGYIIACMIQELHPTSLLKESCKGYGLKVTRPYQNICAMDSREIETHGIIIDMPVKLAFHLRIHF